MKTVLTHLRNQVYEQESIRNMTVIAHVDHGKTTLTDILISKSGMLSEDKAGTMLKTDTMKEEQERGISIKATSISLFYEKKIEIEKEGEKIEESKPHIIHLIDSPGHIDFSSEVTSSLRITDGALVVVDYIEGVWVQTEMVLRQALSEKVRPVLLINKLDKGISKMHEPENFYRKWWKIVNEVNFIISEYIPDDKYQLDPVLGNVAFGSGYFGWAFTIQDMAKKYASIFKSDAAVLAKKFWGDNFYDGKKFTSKFEGIEIEKDRAFNKFIIGPLIKLQNSINEKNIELTKKLVSKLGIEIKEKDWEKPEEDLLKFIFRKWINAGDCILSMWIDHLPSPKEAQKYRIAALFKGKRSSEKKGSSSEEESEEVKHEEELEEEKVEIQEEPEEEKEEVKNEYNDDAVIESMESCDPKGPVMIFISKLFPVDQSFIALGRIFSGTVKVGDKVKVYNAEIKKPINAVVKKVAICMGKDVESIGEMPCGNIVGLGGVDSAIKKEATIMSNNVQASTFKAMKFSVAPVVEVAVRCKKPADQAKFANGLQKLSQSDQLVKVETKESGETVIAGAGDLHVEIWLHQLEYFANCEIIASEPKVSYRETVIDTCEPVLSKSSNKHNRLWATCSTVEEDLCKEIEDKSLLKGKKDHIQKVLRDKFSWDQSDYKKIWSFGIAEASANCIVDKSTSVQYMKEIQGNVVSAFNSVILSGPLANEKLRQVKFNITDAKIHSDPVHRGSNQIIPVAARVLKGAMLSSKPRLQEPVFLWTIKTQEIVRGDIYSAIGNKRGKIIDDIYDGESTIEIKAYLPVAESFGFAEYLRDLTSGRAIPQYVFDHWETIMSDPFEEGSMANEIVKKIRKQKGLPEEIPTPDSYLDKM